MELTDDPWQLLPVYRHLGTEHSGNELLAAGSGDDEWVFGLWHDPPVFFVMARKASEIASYRPANVNENWELPARYLEMAQAVYASPALISRADAIRILPSYFLPWLEHLPEEAMISDLREGQIGTGFTWGHASFVRHPDANVYAVLLLPKRSGLFSRLFGRNA